MKFGWLFAKPVNVWRHRSPQSMLQVSRSLASIAIDAPLDKCAGDLHDLLLRSSGPLADAAEA
eukprot:3827543-Pyramimonas_sp.AAC.1